MPRVSVLMPVYNAGRFLTQAIDSIVEQTFCDWELIVINDGSTDNSKAIIESYSDDRIRYYENESNLKLIKTLNRGIDLCTGEYIARMDADDIASPCRLEEQVGFLDKNPLHIMCGTNATIINNKGERVGKIHNLTTNDFLQINLLFSDPFVHPSMLIRKDILAVNKYDERYRHTEDYELWCRIAPMGLVANLSEELLEYRWHDANVSVVHNDEQNRVKDEIIRQQLQKLDINPSEEELYCHRVTFRLYAMGVKQDVSSVQFDAITNWFDKLVRQNEKLGVYGKYDFVAFLWSRWVVLCISQRKYRRILTPSFASYKPAVLWRMLRLIYLLSKK